VSCELGKVGWSRMSPAASSSSRQRDMRVSYSTSGVCLRLGGNGQLCMGTRGERLSVRPDTNMSATNDNDRLEDFRAVGVACSQRFMMGGRKLWCSRHSWNVRRRGWEGFEDEDWGTQISGDRHGRITKGFFPRCLMSKHHFRLSGHLDVN
jgi:hypothetical protein